MFRDAISIPASTRLPICRHAAYTEARASSCLGYTPGYVGLQEKGGCNPVSWRWDAPKAVWVMGVTHTWLI